MVRQVSPCAGCGHDVRHEVADADLTYDAPASAVAAMLADPAFREDVVEAQHVLRHDVKVTGDPAAGSGTVMVEQVQSATGLPSFARKFVGDEIEIVQDETWTSPTGADLT